MSRIWDALKEAQKQRARNHAPAEFDLSGVDSFGPSATVTEEDRRRASRTTYPFLILVYGSDSANQPFHEEAETIDLTDAGCSLMLETPVVAGQRLFLTNMDNNVETEARVADVGASVAGKSRISLSFFRPFHAFWSRG